VGIEGSHIVVNAAAHRRGALPSTRVDEEEIVTVEEELWPEGHPFVLFYFIFYFNFFFKKQIFLFLLDFIFFFIVIDMCRLPFGCDVAD
jgi:hypothetical protein